MPHYLIQAAYTSDAWASMVKNPQDRADAIRPVIERLGGKLIVAYIRFGKYDTVALAELPDAVSAAALSMATAAGGATKAIETIPLMTTQEALEAARKAGKIGYRPTA